MAIINYYLDPAGAAQTDTADSVGQSLLARWPNGDGVPQGLRIYRGDVADCNDITDTALTDITVLTAPSEDTYNCVVVPGYTYVVQAIIAVVIAVAAVLLMPTPSTVLPNANRNQQSPNNAFGSRSNQPRVNQRSADIRGKQARCYPDLLQVPYRRFRDGIEYEYVYAQIGEGYYAYTNIKDGDTLYERLGGKLAVYGPDTSPLSGTPEFTINGAPTETLYTVTQSNEVDGATLLATDQSDGFGAEYKIYSTGVVEIVGGDVDFTTFVEVGDTARLRNFNVFVLTGVEPDEYNALPIDGAYPVTAVTATEMTLDVSGDADWASIPVGGQTLQSTMYFNDGSGTYWYIPPFEIPVRPITFTPTVATGSEGSLIGPINVTGYDEFLGNIVAQNGIYKDLDGVIQAAGADIEFTIYELDSSDVRTGIFTTAAGTVFSRPGDLTNFTGVSIQAPIPYVRAEITCERTSATVEDSPVDEIKWRDLYLLNAVTSVSPRRRARRRRRARCRR